MKLKSLFLALATGLSLMSNNQTQSMDFSSQNIAITACATLAGVAITKTMYDYFFTLTDSQEFDQAIRLCEQAEQLIESVDQGYGCHDATINWNVIFNTYLIPNRIRYPFFDYVNTMEKNINRIITLEDELSSTKIRIFERRMKIITALTHATHEESIGMRSSIESYDFAIEEIQNIMRSLKLKRKFLQKIKLIVIVHPQYLIEKQQAHIEELEKKLYYSYPYAAHSATTWDHSRSTHHVYVHNTHITRTNNQNTSTNSCTSHNSSDVIEHMEQPQPSAPTLQEIDANKKLKQFQNNCAQQDDLWRDRMYEVGDNFNG